MERLTLACRKAAVRLRQRSSRAIRQLISRVEVGDGTITVMVSTSDLAAYLDLPRAADADEEQRLTIEARLRRAGKVVRLVETGGKPVGHCEPLPHLVRLLELSRAWWQEMQDDQLTAKQMADRHVVDKSYVSRVVRLSFLAPKIIEQTLAGEQPADLDARTLLGLHSPPLRWEDQERLLLAR